MWLALKRLLRKICDVLVADSIPVWLSLFLMIIGAIATYYVAPLINEQFEIQGARREFIVKNLEEFSGSTKDLIDVVSKAVNENTQFKYDALVAETNPSITKLQFSATQLLYIVPENHAEIVGFQRALVAMQDELLAHRVGQDGENILAISKQLMRQSLVIYDSLLRKAGFSIRR